MKEQDLLGLLDQLLTENQKYGQAISGGFATVEARERLEELKKNFKQSLKEALEKHK